MPRKKLKENSSNESGAVRRLRIWGQLTRFTSQRQLRSGRILLVNETFQSN